MAVKYAVATGNWSATSTWNGGTLPSAGDDVYANGYTVSVDQDIEVNKISTEVCPTTSVGGGRFNVNTSFKTIISNIIAGTTYCVYTEGDISLTIIGNIYASSVTAVAGSTHRCTINIIGNVYGGSGSDSFGVRNYYNSNISVIGNVYGGTGKSSYGVYLQNGGTLTVTGNITAGLSYAIYVSTHQIGQSLTITGNVFASLNSSAVFCFNTIFYGSLLSALGGYQPINVSGGNLFIDSTNVQMILQNTANDEIRLYTADAFDQPGEENVRNGISYASGTLEGTLAVPPPESVVKNVPVDDTVGTYELTPEVIEHITELKNPKKVLGSGIIAYQ
jgi:hypothetical protein